MRTGKLDSSNCFQMRNRTVSKALEPPQYHLHSPYDVSAKPSPTSPALFPSMGKKIRSPAINTKCQFFFLNLRNSCNLQGARMQLAYTCQKGQALRETPPHPHSPHCIVLGMGSFPSSVGLSALLRAEVNGEGRLRSV